MDKQDIINRVGEAWHRLTSRPWFWQTVPFVVMGLVALLLMVKGCQGIRYHCSDEYKVHRLGYTVQQAQDITARLSARQVDSLIASQQLDTAICPLICCRYFIAPNLERYLALCHKESAATPGDVVAMVNVGADRQWFENAVPSDTGLGYAMLVNKFHYLEPDYRRGDMATFPLSCTYERNQAAHAVVEAFKALQQACLQRCSARLMVNSSYRSYDEQMAVYGRYSDNLAARPGYSEHQSGLCIDVTSLEHPAKWVFGKSAEGVWMREHCHEFGFILRYPQGKERITGYDYEPWHLRYVGKETARRVHDEGITFDEYHAFYLDNPSTKITETSSNTTL